MISPSSLSAEFVRPAPALVGLISGYHVYRAGPAGGPVWEEIFFPGWANIRFVIEDGGWSAGPEGQRLSPVPAASLFGPASRAIASRASGGTMVGIGITPLGWLRLFDVAAVDVADRIVPLEALAGEEAQAMLSACRNAATPDAIAAGFDRWLVGRLRPPRPTHPLASRLFDYLLTAHDIGIGDACVATGASHTQLRRVARDHFGFPTKLLLRRSRFLKSLMPLLAAPPGQWSSVIDPGYFDYPHFVRDAREFLGMSPRAFLALERPMTMLSMHNRQRDLGAPVQGLHRI